MERFNNLVQDSQQQHQGNLEPKHSLWWEVVLCIIECLAMPLAFIHHWQQFPDLKPWLPKTRLYQMLLWQQNSPVIKTCGPPECLSGNVPKAAVIHRLWKYLNTGTVCYNISILGLVPDHEWIQHEDSHWRASSWNIVANDWVSETWQKAPECGYTVVVGTEKHWCVQRVQIWVSTSFTPHNNLCYVPVFQARKPRFKGLDKN